MTSEDVSALKVTNPEGWFLTTQTIPPDDFKAMTTDEKKAMTACLADPKERATTPVGILKSPTKGAASPGKSPRTALTVETGEAALTAPATPVSPKPKVQFGRGCHPANDNDDAPTGTAE